jgi:hypothetical protein
MNANLTYLVERIEAELDRLGANGDLGIEVEARSEWPEGYLCVYDQQEEASGWAHDILESLEAATIEGHETEENPGFAAAWNALAHLSESEPGREEWKDAHDFILDIPFEGGGETGYALVALRTNGGLRFGYAPADPDAGVTTHDFSQRFETAQDAIDAALSLASQLAAEAECESR